MRYGHRVFLSLISLAWATAAIAQSPQREASPATDRAGPISTAVPDATQSRWSNFYVGLNTGLGWSQFKQDGFTALYANVSNINVPGRGIIVVPGTSATVSAASTDWTSVPALGVQAGYKRGVWNRLWRLEADLNAPGSRHGTTSHAILFPTTALTFGNMVHLQREMHSSWTSSLRLRGDEAWRGNLIYGAVGLAAARVTVTERDSTFSFLQPEVTFERPTFVVPPFGSGLTQSQTHFGWTAAIGTERDWSPRTTVAIEYRYNGFGKKMYSLADTSGDLFATGGPASGVSGTHAMIFPDPVPIRLSGSQITVRANVRLPLW